MPVLLYSQITSRPYTHIWMWWVDVNPRLPVTLARPVEEWIDEALCYPGIHLLDLTPRIVVESTQLPGTFHRDPADQLIVATARVFDCPLVTVDTRILNYPYVETRP